MHVAQQHVHVDRMFKWLIPLGGAELLMKRPRRNDRACTFHSATELTAYVFFHCENPTGILVPSLLFLSVVFSTASRKTPLHTSLLRCCDGRRGKRPTWSSSF